MSRVPRLLICLLIVMLVVVACGGGATTPASTVIATTPATTTANASCSQIVKAALATVAGRCNNLDSNEVCFGNPNIDVAAANASVAFKAPGDIVKLADLKTIHTAPLDQNTGTWGIAVMRAAVNLPGTAAGQQVTIIMYGDTSLDSFGGDMKTVNIRTGIGNVACDELPPSGMTVQVPHGQHITFTMNGVSIGLGSTAVITASPDKDLSISVLEGHADVSAQGFTQALDSGEKSSVPLKNGVADGPPSPPQPIAMSDVHSVPVTLLSDPISPSSIQSAIDQAGQTATARPTIPTTTPTIVSGGTAQPSITPLFTWTPGPTLSQAGASGQNRIAYASNVNGDWEIFTMKSDGSGAARLTTRQGDDRSPTWSPDGSHIAFAAFTGQVFQIYTMSDTGANLTPLTQTDGSAGHPAWSPDGKSIVYDFLKDNNRDIYVIDTGGGNARALASNPTDDSDPTWSPDGQHIAFVSQRDGNKEIYVMDADGSNVTRITNNPADDVAPAWSPDGKRIAFESNRSGSNNIYLMDADGKNLSRVTSAPANDELPTWSADGSQIAFVSDRGGTRAIYIVAATGGAATRITDPTSDADDPAWQH